MYTRTQCRSESGQSSWALTLTRASSRLQGSRVCWSGCCKLPPCSAKCACNTLRSSSPEPCHLHAKQHSDNHTGISLCKRLHVEPLPRSMGLPRGVAPSSRRGGGGGRGRLPRGYPHSAHERTRAHGRREGWWRACLRPCSEWCPRKPQRGWPPCAYAVAEAAVVAHCWYGDWGCC